MQQKKQKIVKSEFIETHSKSVNAVLCRFLSDPFIYFGHCDPIYTWQFPSYRPNYIPSIIDIKTSLIVTTFTFIL